MFDSRFPKLHNSFSPFEKHLTILKSHPKTTGTYQILPQLYIVYVPHYVGFQVSKVARQFFLDFILFKKPQMQNPKITAKHK